MGFCFGTGGIPGISAKGVKPAPAIVAKCLITGFPINSYGIGVLNLDTLLQTQYPTVGPTKAVEATDTQLFAAIVTVPGALKYSQKTLPVVFSTVTYPAGRNYAYYVIKDDTYLWVLLVGTFSSGGSATYLMRHLLSDPSIYTEYVIGGVGSYGIGMWEDGTYIYVCTNTTPGKIIRVLKSNPATITTYTLAGSSSMYVIDANDPSGMYFYVGGDDLVGTVYRVTRSNPTIFSSISLGAHAVYSIFEDSGDYIWMGCLEGEVVRITRSTFTYFDKTFFPGRVIAGIAKDGVNLWMVGHNLSYNYKVPIADINARIATAWSTGGWDPYTAVITNEWR